MASIIINKFPKCKHKIKWDDKELKNKDEKGTYTKRKKGKSI